MSEQVTLESKADVAVVTVNRPQNLNALNEEVMATIGERIGQATTETDARALVLTGAGEKAFVAGADIGQMREMGPEQARAFSQAGHALVEQVETLAVPVIAAVDGFALGGGLELALACDIRVAAQGSTFGAPEVGLGVIPGFGGTQRLARVCGLGAGLDLVLTGRQIDAAEAHRIGLVTHLVEQGQALSRALELGGTIAGNGPVAIECAKRTVRQGFDASVKTADELETEAFAACFGTQDQQEGMTAFLEKREAAFTGE